MARTNRVDTFNGFLDLTMAWNLGTKHNATLDGKKLLPLEFKTETGDTVDLPQSTDKFLESAILGTNLIPNPSLLWNEKDVTLVIEFKTHGSLYLALGAAKQITEFLYSKGIR